ncbi:MAG: hypothetical protein P1P84_20590 [Deferrisomatales bacterium]|nr:hypothetical protein [Deferrisomatales bacterium]
MTDAARCATPTAAALHALFSKVYRGRDDRVALWQEAGYRPVPGGLDASRLGEHLRLENTYALYPEDDDGGVWFALFDLDVLPRRQEWRVMREKIEGERAKTLRLMETLLDLGLRRENLLLEFPTVGFHLVLCFSEPVAVAPVRRFMQHALERAGLGGTPYYPKQSAPGAPGKPVQIPFRMNRNTGRRSNLIEDIETFDPDAYDPTPDFRPLERVIPLPPEVILAHG